ncbi:MAG: transglycosylase SLT domain-containing protein [Alphaproteobacteria bacterium]|nr:transglycosylase SLT domain-containing protein [Alphaproteobacteria bacterium]
MDSVAKTIQAMALPKGLQGLASKAPTHVLGAIQRASAEAGVDFSYMVQQAHVESSFDPQAKARTSSASGLYQFIESTWMAMVRDHGAKYGLADLAAQIDARGKVADRATRQEILKLRQDPEIAAHMAAELAQDNRQVLETNWGGDIGSTELYLAHFMGAGGASAFLKAKDSNPLQEAAVLFPAAAKSNRSVFYDTKSGRPRSVQEVYNFFDRKFEIKDKTPVSITPATLVVEAAPSIMPQAVATPVRSVLFQQLMDRTARLEIQAVQDQTDLFSFGTRTVAPPPVPYASLIRNPAQVMVLAMGT